MYDKRNMPTWIAKIKESGPFSLISAWSKKLPNFVVKHVDLSWDFGHDVPCMGWRIDVNNEGGLDTRPSSLYWQIEPGCSSCTSVHTLSWMISWWVMMMMISWSGHLLLDVAMSRDIASSVFSSYTRHRSFARSCKMRKNHAFLGPSRLFRTIANFHDFV